VDEGSHDRGDDQDSERDRGSSPGPTALKTPARDRSFPRGEHDDAQADDAVRDHDPAHEARTDEPGSHTSHEREQQECKQGEVRPAAGHVLIVPWRRS
jgi:hypothetical protein